MKFFYTLLIVAAVAICAQAEAEVPAEVPEAVADPAPVAAKKGNWFQGIWNKVQEINPFDDMFNHLKKEFENSAQGKDATDGKGNPIVDLLVWVFQNKEQILKYIENGVQDVLNNIKQENPVCELINHLKETNFLPTEKKVSSAQLKPLMAKLEEMKKDNPILQMFYGPISEAVQKFSKSNPICKLLTSFQETHPIFVIIKNLAKVNPLFGTLEDIYNESKQCLCAFVNPTEFAMEMLG